MHMDAEVTAVEAAAGMPDVTRHLIYLWAKLGKIKQIGKRGRSPLYRWGDILAVEAKMRLTPNSARKMKVVSGAA